jgi:hypothetical protein
MQAGSAAQDSPMLLLLPRCMLLMKLQQCS